MSTEILMDIKEWRRANPRATYVQIEDEVHKRVMHLEARLIQEAAEGSPSREWGRGSTVDAALQRFSKRLMVLLMSFKQPSACEDQVPDSHSAKTNQKRL
jgi:hypothetical protein